MLGDKIERDRLQIERYWSVHLDRECLPEGFDAGLYSGLSLECTVDHPTLLHSPLSILPAKGNMHRNGEHPE